MFAGDMDGDGKSDMTILNQSTTTMSVLLNNPLSPITGATQVCAGGTTLSTITLSDATAGGFWSSSNTAFATVGSTTGVVTGVSAGVVTITYYGTAQSGPVTGNYTTYTVTVNALPTPTFTSSPGATTCEGSSVTYTTQSGQTNYVWSVPGTAGTDYVITAGGIGTSSNTVTLQWFTSGAKTVTVNYTSPSGCTNATGASNTTTIQMAPTVASLTPALGFPSSSVAIAGTDFNTTPANNIVYFGTTRATVTSATTTLLNVTVPTEAAYAFVSVNNNGCSLQAASSNQYLPYYNNAAFVPNTVNFDPVSVISVGAGTNPGSVSVGDLDGDGKSDLVVTNFNAGTVYVYKNSSTSGSLTAGSFTLMTTLSGFNTPSSVATGDLDGDGKLDIAFVDRATVVYVAKNTSSGVGSFSFSGAVSFGTGPNDWDVKIADMDKDGKPDLIVSNFNSNNISVLRNTWVGSLGGSSFAPQQSFATGAGPFNIAVGDIDLDGFPDVVVPNRSTNTISVLKNTSHAGTISLAAQVTFPAVAGVFAVAVGDVDGDGKLDVLSGNASGANTVSVFRNNTTTVGVLNSSSLFPKVDFATGATPTTLGLGDIDGDGKPDVLVPNLGSSTVSVLRNTSTSGGVSFGANVEFKTSSGSAPIWVAVDDMDGDGKADVVVADEITSVALLHNDPLSPIAGLSTVCGGGLTGTTITLTDATPNGVWTSSNPAVATVGSLTGIVTGLSGGVVTITYSGTSGIGNLGNYTTKTITVNPIVVAPTNSSVVCVGGLVNFTSGVTAAGILTYAWSGPAGYSSALPNPGISFI
jgi:hypothetical protein